MFFQIFAGYSRRFFSLFFSLLLFIGITDFSGKYPVHSMETSSSSFVREGMRGYALSVFQGTRIERYPVVVVGVLKKHLAQSDMFLIRLEGGYPVRHKIGIIAGMSGSPVYINGRLIGAIAYGWPFSSEPIGGVTPIESMLQELPGSGKKASSTGKRTGAVYNLQNPLKLSGNSYDQVVVTDSFNPDRKKFPQSALILSPVSAMLEMQGFSPATVRFAEKFFEPLGLHPVAVSAGGRIPRSAGYKVVPGSAVGITLVDGDLYMGGNGTVTYRNGDDFLAFGHSMMQLGSVEVPVNSAYVNGIMASLSRSFRFSSSMGIIGTILEDRFYAVSGSLGKRPPMIPVTIDVFDQSRNWKKKFNLRCISHPRLSGWVMASSVFESLTSSATMGSYRTAEIKFSLKIKGFERINFSDIVYSHNIQEEVGMQVLKYLSSISRRNFEPFEIEDMKLAVTILKENRVATIEDVSAQLISVSPGDNIKLKLRLKTCQGDMFTREVKLPVPPDVDKGKIQIGVTGGFNTAIMEKKMLTKPLPPYTPEQLLYRLADMERNSELIIDAVYPRNSIAFAGEYLRFLPKSKVSVFLSSPRSISVPYNDRYRVKVKIPYFVEGEEIIFLQIADSAPATKETREKETELVDDVPSADDSSSDKNQDGEGETTTLTVTQKRVSSFLGKKIPMIPVAEGVSVPKTAGKSSQYAPSDENTFNLSTARDFFSGTFKGTSITDGNITLACKSRKLFNSGSAFIFAMDYDKAGGKMILGESPSGYIIEVDGDGKSRIIFKTGEVLITTLERDVSGNIYVGTAPHGKIFRISPQGKTSLFCTLSDRIIWDILAESDGSLLVCTGDSGKLYRITPDGKAGVIFDSEQAHVNCVARDNDGNIYAGTANEGNIYKIDTAGNSEFYFRAMGDSVDSLCFENGNLWFASEEILYEIRNGCSQKVYIFPENNILCVKPDGRGNILAGTSDMGRVYRINRDGFTENLFEDDINQVLNINTTAGGDILASTGNPGKVLKILGSYVDSAEYITRVFDTTRVSRFGNICWQADTPEGTSLTFQTRSGNTSKPDNTWSGWSGEYSFGENQRILSPPGRYLQIKANLKTTGNGTPKIYSINFFYEMAGSSPLLLFETPTGGEFWSGKQEIEWKSFLARPETLAFSLFSSGDSGKTWKPMAENLEIGPDSKIVPGRGNTAYIKESHKFHTRKLKNGRYMFKLIGFDKRNPSDKDMRAEIISKPVVICNDEPQVTIMESVERDGQGVISGFAKAGVNLKEVVYRINDRDWAFALAQDGIFDSYREKFLIYFNKPCPSSAKLTVKVTDSAGNSNISKHSIRFKKVSGESAGADSSLSEEKDKIKGGTEKRIP